MAGRCTLDERGIGRVEVLRDVPNHFLFGVRQEQVPLSKHIAASQGSESRTERASEVGRRRVGDGELRRERNTGGPCRRLARRRCHQRRRDSRPVDRMHQLHDFIDRGELQFDIRPVARTRELIEDRDGIGIAMGDERVGFRHVVVVVHGMRMRLYEEAVLDLDRVRQPALHHEIGVLEAIAIGRVVVVERGVIGLEPGIPDEEAIRPHHLRITANRCRLRLGQVIGALQVERQASEGHFYLGIANGAARGKGEVAEPAMPHDHAELILDLANSWVRPSQRPISMDEAPTVERCACLVGDQGRRQGEEQVQPGLIELVCAVRVDPVRYRTVEMGVVARPPLVMDVKMHFMSVFTCQRSDHVRDLAIMLLRAATENDAVVQCAARFIVVVCARLEMVRQIHAVEKAELGPVRRVACLTLKILNAFEALGVQAAAPRFKVVRMEIVDLAHSAALEKLGQRICSQGYGFASIGGRAHRDLRLGLATSALHVYTILVEVSF